MAIIKSSADTTSHQRGFEIRLEDQREVEAAYLIGFGGEIFENFQDAHNVVRELAWFASFLGATDD